MIESSLTFMANYFLVTTLPLCFHSPWSLWPNSFKEFLVQQNLITKRCSCEALAILGKFGLLHSWNSQVIWWGVTWRHTFMDFFLLCYQRGPIYMLLLKWVHSCLAKENIHMVISRPKGDFPKINWCCHLWIEKKKK